jgi:quercetin dioxygenase-like cupin family protein
MAAPATPRPHVVGATEGDALWFLGNLITVKATGADTGGRASVVEFLNPPGFAPPLHRHVVEDEMFLVLGGEALFLCDGQEMAAGPGDFVVLPAGLPHSFIVGPTEPLRTLQITTPAGWEQYAVAVGEPAGERRLPGPRPVDRDAMVSAAARYGIEILGPPPVRAG